MSTVETERPVEPRNRGAVERNGINVIAEAERKGKPRDLFWPWCASNVSVLAVAYGSFVLGFGLGVWQAILAAVVGAVVSFFLVGLVSIAGKRGSAPTLVLSRAAFGKWGNALPGLVSYLLLVGWETVLVALSTLATATVFGRLGWASGDTTKIVAFLVVALVIVVAGVLGFDTIMWLQKWLTVAMVVVTVVYVALTADQIDFGTLGGLAQGNATATIGATIFVMTGFGVGWVNSAADYSRYLPRTASTGGVVGWPTLGGSLPVVVLVVFGILLAGSSQDLNAAIANDPIGALTTVLPTWFLVPFAVVAVLGLISGAMLDIYSSGLTLLTLGLRIPRWSAAALDGVLMILGAIYIIWWSGSDFIYVFEGFLITLGVPMAAWCGVFLADLLVRRRDYDEAALFDAHGRYGAFRPLPVLVFLLGTGVGWGLVTAPYGSKGLDWLGYLLDARVPGLDLSGTVLDLGGRKGDWAFANLGVPVALLIGVVGYVLLGSAGVWRQGRSQKRDEAAAARTAPTGDVRPVPAERATVDPAPTAVTPPAASPTPEDGGTTHRISQA